MTDRSIEASRDALVKEIVSALRGAISPYGKPTREAVRTIVANTVQRFSTQLPKKAADIIEEARMLHDEPIMFEAIDTIMMENERLYQSWYMQQRDRIKMERAAREDWNTCSREIERYRRHLSGDASTELLHAIDALATMTPNERANSDLFYSRIQRARRAASNLVTIPADQ